MDPRRQARPTTPLLVAAGFGLSAAMTFLIATGGAIDGLRGGPAPTASPQAVPAEAAAPLTSDASRFAFWGRDHRGDPLRWDACEPILFVLNTAGAPTHAEQDLRQAMAIIAGASGLDLVLAGHTEERPARDRPLVERQGDGWRWRPVLVAWADPETADVPLSSFDRGVALPVAVRAGDREAFVTGQLVMNARRTDLSPGFDDRSDALGATLLHELGHILGLDHVADPAELMSADPGSGPVELGPGDRAGLRELGAAAGCNPAPPASAGRGLRVAR